MPVAYRSTARLYGQRAKTRSARGRRNPHAVAKRMMRALGDRRARCRFDVVGPCWGQLETTDVAPHVSTQVKVVDLSLAGVLLLARDAVQIGSRARLSLKIDDEPITADVEVRRVAHAGSSGTYVGVRIVEMGHRYRDLIEEVTRQ